MWPTAAPTSEPPYAPALDAALEAGSTLKRDRKQDGVGRVFGHLLIATICKKFAGHIVKPDFKQIVETSVGFDV